MNKYQQAIQHYVMYNQNARAQVTLPWLFISACSILFIDFLFGIKRAWWAIGILTLLFAVSIVGIFLTKDIYKRHFYKIELLGISFLLSLTILAMFLIRFLCNSFLYAVIMWLLASAICTFFMQLDFFKKIKKDYYMDTSIQKAKEKNSAWIALIIVFSMHAVIRLFMRTVSKNILQTFILTPLLLCIAGFFSALIFMSIQKIYFILKYKLNLNPELN